MRLGFVWILALVGFLFVACASRVEYVNDPDKYSSLGLDYQDLERATQESIDSFLNSSFAKNMPKDKPKVLAISDVINDTMQHFDVEMLGRKIVREMRNSGKFMLTNTIAGSGGSVDSMIGKSRNLRENEEFDQYGVAEKGTLSAPEYSLSGKILQRNTKVGSNQRVDYYFLLTLTDLKSGLVVWDNEVSIKKVGSNKDVAW